jgi:hypothetical protein
MSEFPHRGFHFVRERKIFMHGRTPLRGITSVLQRTFFPKYTISKAQRHATAEKEKGKEKKGKKMQKGTRLSPLARGRLIDADITRVIRTRNAERSKMHAHSWTLCQTIETKKWDMVRSQLFVGSPTHLLGTAVDLVCADKRKPDEYILVENKSGYIDYYHSDCGNSLPAPFQDFKDSSWTTHQLQLTLTRKLFELTYPTKKIKAAYVAVMHDQGISWFPHHTYFKDHSADVLKMCAPVKYPTIRPQNA